MKVSDIRRILILGAGTMGQQIGLLCAMHGYDVVLYDLSAEILSSSLRRMRKLGEWFVDSGKIQRGQLDSSLGRISATTDAGEAAREVDLISESVPEDPKLKGEIFSRFNDLCPERTVFTTNSSMFVPSMFAESTGRPERFAALHFHDTRVTHVVDLMPHPGTAKEIVDLIHDFATSLDQVVITLQKENNGYVFNTMLSSLFSSALALASRNVASIEDIDRSWMGIMHMPIGPFGMMDQIGLSTVWTITAYWAEKTGEPQARANADFLKRYVDKKLLGLKTGEGFYKYPNPAHAEPGFLSGEVKAK